MNATFLTPKEVAKRLNVSPETVLGWVKSGELPAINAGGKGRVRPRYRIVESDLDSFISRRYVGAAGKGKSSGRRGVRRKDPEVIEFFQ